MQHISIPEIAMVETLFGGVLLAAGLFFASRRLGLSSFWAGILSGALPFFAYLIYSAQHWGGGDVLAIHFAVYLATAGVLMVFGDMQQKKQKMHWAPRIIIWFFVGLVVLNAVLLSVASRGLPDFFTRLLLPSQADQEIHTAFPGVIPHDRNKSYEPHLQKLEQQRDLGWQVTLLGFDALRRDQAGNIEVAVTDAYGEPLRQAQVSLVLWRMANSRDDRVVILGETGPGMYAAKITLPHAGRWLARLHIERGQDHYQKQQQLFIGE